MKITKTRKNKLLILSLSTATLILCGLFGLYIFNTQQDSQKTKDSSATPERSQSDIDQSIDLESNPDNKSTNANTDTPVTPEKDDSTGKITLQMVASSNISNGVLYVRGGINNSIETEGSCYAKLRGPNGEEITKETTLLQNSSTTDCKTISIPLSELSPGQWRFTLNFTSATKSGVTNELTFEL